MKSKADVICKLAAEDEAAFKSLEAKIDLALDRHDGRTTVRVTGVPRRVIDAVKARYAEGGWDVVLTGDERDGPFLAFT